MSDELEKELHDKILRVIEHKTLDEEAATELILEMFRERELDMVVDLDEIDNKPWRVFRQLAVLRPDYALPYKRYEAFYAFGGSRAVEALIDEFENTDDFKGSYFYEDIKSLKDKENE